MVTAKVHVLMFNEGPEQRIILADNRQQAFVYTSIIQNGRFLNLVSTVV